jgi:hypothetical protein
MRKRGTHAPRAKAVAPGYLYQLLAWELDAAEAKWQAQWEAARNPFEAVAWFFSPKQTAVRQELNGRYVAARKAAGIAPPTARDLE